MNSVIRKKLSALSTKVVIAYVPEPKSKRRTADRCVPLIRGASAVFSCGVESHFALSLFDTLSIRVADYCVNSAILQHIRDTKLRLFSFES